jgi:8-oxo-dGTP diphosphatase
MKAKKWEGEPTNLEPNKCDELSWFPINALPQNTIVPVRAALKEIDKGSFYSNWGWNR